jgi:hypothetical protein
VALYGAIGYQKCNNKNPGILFRGFIVAEANRRKVLRQECRSLLWGLYGKETHKIKKSIHLQFPVGFYLPTNLLQIFYKSKHS